MLLAICVMLFLSPLLEGMVVPGNEVTFGHIATTNSAFAYQPTFGENPSFRGEPVEIRFMGNS